MSIKLLQALQDCVSVMANDLKGMAIIQPELEQAQKALADHFRPVEWDGLGMPPAGAECEMRRLDYVDVDWQEIKFLCAGEKKAFFMDSEGHEWSRPLSEIKFRPIRTPEQIAADAREKEFQEIRDVINNALALSGDPAIALYAQGYRKQVAVVRELTQEAEDERYDYERHIRDYGGCSCHISPPCGACTHPGNPLNQEDDSCWQQVAP